MGRCGCLQHRFWAAERSRCRLFASTANLCVFLFGSVGSTWASIYSHESSLRSRADCLAIATRNHLLRPWIRGVSGEKLSVIRQIAFINQLQNQRVLFARTESVHLQIVRAAGRPRSSKNASADTLYADMAKRVKKKERRVSVVNGRCAMSTNFISVGLATTQSPHQTCI